MVRVHLPPARSQQRTLWLPGASHAGGTQSSNPLCSSGESIANLTSAIRRIPTLSPFREGVRPSRLAGSRRQTVPKGAGRIRILLQPAPLQVRTKRHPGAERPLRQEREVRAVRCRGRASLRLRHCGDRIFLPQPPAAADRIASDPVKGRPAVTQKPSFDEYLITAASALGFPGDVVSAERAYEISLVAARVSVQSGDILSGVLNALKEIPQRYAGGNPNLLFYPAVKIDEFPIVQKPFASRWPAQTPRSKPRSCPGWRRDGCDQASSSSEYLPVVIEALSRLL
jgi:hypothetical protein